jgi:hypothetical protein
MKILSVGAESFLAEGQIVVTKITANAPRDVKRSNLPADGPISCQATFLATDS